MGKQRRKTVKKKLSKEIISEKRNEGDAPTAPAEWKAKGNRHYKEMQYNEAIKCYEQAIEALPSASLALIFFQNMANASIKLKQYSNALCYSIGAIILTKNYQGAKANFRAAESLEALGFPELGCLCAQYFQHEPHRGKKLKGFLKKLKHVKIRLYNPWQQNKDMIEIIVKALSEYLKEIEVKSFGQSALQLKEKGNECFQHEKYGEALSYYTCGLRLLESQNEVAPLPILLSNRAACYHQLDLHGQAVLDTIGAMFVSPSFTKCYFRQATSLLALGYHDAALLSCINGLESDHENCVLLKLKQKIEYLMDCSNHHVRGEKREHSNKENENYAVLTERTVEKQIFKSTMDTQSLAEMSTMLEMSQGLIQDRNKLEKFNSFLSTLVNKIPKIHEEFQEEVWPRSCNINRCMALLSSIYENNRQDLYRVCIIYEKEFVNEEILLRRVRSNLRNEVDWFYDAAIGDVRDYVGPGYHSLVHHSFSNMAQLPKRLSYGTNHVSIGFTDFTELMKCVLVGDSCDGPLCWHGYEQSPYSVAKSYVIWKMIRQNAPVDSIIEVWYSACWGHSTYACFQRALNSLLYGDSAPYPYPSSVYLVFLCWEKSGTISLQQARAKWLDNLTCSWDEILNYKLKKDRLSLCRYAITGELFDADVGSTVMFAIPPEVGDICLNEKVYESITWDDLKAYRNGCEMSIMDHIIAYLQDKIKKLCQLIQRGDVIIKALKVASITPTTESVLNEIRQLNPWTINWSNLCDYFSTKDFQRMLEASSACEDTVHFVCSMNWPTNVKGAFSIDYPLNARKKLLKNTEMLLEQFYEGQMMEKQLIFPPITNAMNIIDFGLCGMFCKQWVEWFMKSMGIQKQQFTLRSPPLFHILQRTNSTIEIVVTFDKGIYFTTSS